ncbi:MAG: adenine phosphoribosyltransferase [Candidatus Daviesbacteria bacterium]|nr:adenine phosphoribosyltransferase [Candidatus Daviesbacteria bacterium]
MNLKFYIREIPNWPKQGVNFKDITTLLQNPRLFKYIVGKMAKSFKDQKIDKVAAIDARGFLLAAPIAYKIGAGVCLIRKKGKLPYQTIEERFEKEYGEDILAIHKDTIKKGERILIVDDLLATGGTAAAATRLVEKLGGEIIAMSFLIDLPFLGGSKKLSKYKLEFLVTYDKE